jgi:hypothetical protein
MADVDRTDLVSGQEEVVGSCEEGNEHSDSVKYGGFLDCMRNYWFLTKDTAPLS